MQLYAFNSVNRCLQNLLKPTNLQSVFRTENFSEENPKVRQIFSGMVFSRDGFLVTTVLFPNFYVQLNFSKFAKSALSQEIAFLNTIRKLLQTKFWNFDDFPQFNVLKVKANDYKDKTDLLSDQLMYIHDIWRDQPHFRNSKLWQCVAIKKQFQAQEAENLSWTVQRTDLLQSLSYPVVWQRRKNARIAVLLRFQLIIAKNNFISLFIPIYYPRTKFDYFCFLCVFSCVRQFSNYAILIGILLIFVFNHLITYATRKNQQTAAIFEKFWDFLK